MLRSACVKKLEHFFSLELVEKIEKTIYDPIKSDEGFILLDSINETNFYFQYLRKSSFTYTEYQNKLILKKGETIKETFFEIDLENMYLIIYAGKAQSEFLIRKLEPICEVSFISIDIEFSRIFDLLKQSKYICRIEQVEIDNFNHNDLLIGKYITKIQEENLLQIIINEYRKNISKLVISIDDYDTNRYLIKISRNSSFFFDSISEHNYEVLRFIMSNLF